MQETQISNFKINKLTKAQYTGITPNQNEVYITTDEAGAVASVNSITPNASGNVTIKTSNITNDSGYITSSALSGYATETWVGNQGYITGINSGDVTTALGYTPVNPSNLATVATSGSYADLSNTPTIPTVNNGTLTVTQGGNTLGTFTANQSGNTTINIASGASRNIGEIVQSTIPLTDAGLHLLDGTLLSGSGSYADFVDYIADLYDSGDYTAIFDTEANWQSAVTTYGICDKFVYDSVNDTVRLPKWGTQAYTKNPLINIATASTVPLSIYGTGEALGLTDGSSDLGLQAGYTSSSAYWLTAGTSASGTNVGSSSGSYLSSRLVLGVNTSSSKSGLTGTANTSGVISSYSLTNYPLNCYYYIVVATTTKTAIEVDIDEIATDLNGKADTDLTNLTATSSTNFDGQWVQKNGSVYGSSSGQATGTYTYSLSSYLPNDGQSYEVMVNVVATTTGTYAGIQFTSNYVSPAATSRSYLQMTCTPTTTAGSFIIPIGSDRNLNYFISSAGTDYLYIRLYAYRRIGTNG